jgi:phosphoribosylformylglycinamidine (FGAM) synthase PurS component
MTHSPRADSRPVAMKMRIVTLLAGAIVGSIIGIAAWTLLLASSYATAIVSIGRYDPSTSWIEEPQAVIERIKSAEFASAVAARAGVADLATQLPSRQYGGKGALSVRNLRDLNILEIKIDAYDPEVAKKAITAVVDQLLAEHSAKIEPLIQDLDSRLKSLESITAATIQSNDALTKRIGSISPIGDEGVNGIFALSARASSDTGLGAMVTGAAQLKMLVANIRRSRAVTAPNVRTPNFASLFRIITAGAVAGFLFALLLLQMFPSFFRTSPVGARLTQPTQV